MVRREAAPKSCALQGQATPLPQTLPGAGGAETPPETETTDNQLGSEAPGKREGIYKPGTGHGALRNLRGEQLPHPQGNQRGKTPTHSKLRHPAEATEGASKSPSKFRTFSQTSAPAHLTSLPMAGSGCSSESQGHRWEPDPNLHRLHLCSIKLSARTSTALLLTPETAPGHRKGSEVGDGS